MPDLVHHQEAHSKASVTVRDVVLGMADGLTVPFALAAGVAGAVASTRIVVTAGLAEIAAGAIAMGLGGYLAARGDIEHFKNERNRELHETHHIPDEDRREVSAILERYGLDADQARSIAETLSRDRGRWVDIEPAQWLGDEPDRTVPVGSRTVDDQLQVDVRAGHPLSKLRAEQELAGRAGPCDEDDPAVFGTVPQGAEHDGTQWRQADSAGHDYRVMADRGVKAPVGAERATHA